MCIPTQGHQCNLETKMCWTLLQRCYWPEKYVKTSLGFYWWDTAGRALLAIRITMGFFVWRFAREQSIERDCNNKRIFV